MTVLSFLTDASSKAVLTLVEGLILSAKPHNFKLKHYRGLAGLVLENASETRA
jgi:hypothetical protein